MTVADHRYRPREGVIETDLDDELVLLDPDTQQMYSLNETGRWLWRRLPESPKALAQGLAESFAVGLEQARNDVAELLAELREAGLLAGG